jgi:hypothetical protein
MLNNELPIGRTVIGDREGHEEIFSNPADRESYRFTKYVSSGNYGHRTKEDAAR